MSRTSGMNKVASELIHELKERSNPSNVKGMGRYGINVDNALGIPMPIIRAMAKRIGKNHELALLVWDSKIHEARILAALIDEPEKVSFEQMESWILEVDSWDVCDQLCANLLDKTIYAYPAAKAWSKRDEVFVKRAGYVLMAALAVHDKKAKDEVFLDFLESIYEGASDNRNFVKKSVNWALRQIGKRNLELNKAAISMAERIDKSGSNSAHWIAKDALRELRSEAAFARLLRKASPSKSRR